MQDGIVGQIAQWSEGKIEDEKLIEVLEGSRPDLEKHRSGFQAVVDDLNEAQQERCGEIVEYCFQLLTDMEEAVERAVESVKAGDRNTLFVAGDTIARSSYQLNRAFTEFRNQALYALGPTDIPNLNLLMSKRDELLEDPSENTLVLFQEAIDSERIVVYEGLKDLAKEPDIPEVVGLIAVFREHLSALNTLARIVEEDAEEADYEPIFFELGNSFRSLQERVPMVQMKLRTLGETSIPDINYLIGLLEDVAKGEMGDEMLVSALEELDESFGKSREGLEQATGRMDSALANDELEAVQETFEEFDEGMEAAYKFLDHRETAHLVEAKGCFLEFAKRFSAHQERLKEIEANQGKVLCPSCATFNEVGRSRCDKCGGPLPQNVAATASTTFSHREQGAMEKEVDVLITANIAKVYEAVNAIAAGEISDEEFLAEVQRFENLVEANAGGIPQEPDMGDAGKQKMVTKLYDDFEHGVEAFRKAIDILVQYPETGSEEALAEGVRLINEGALKINKASEAFSGAPS